MTLVHRCRSSETGPLVVVVVIGVAIEYPQGRDRDHDYDNDNDNDNDNENHLRRSLDFHTAALGILWEQFNRGFLGDPTAGHGPSVISHSAAGAGC